MSHSGDTLVEDILRDVDKLHPGFDDIIIQTGLTNVYSFVCLPCAKSKRLAVMERFDLQVFYLVEMPLFTAPQVKVVRLELIVVWLFLSLAQSFT